MIYYLKLAKRINLVFTLVFVLLLLGFSNIFAADIDTYEQWANKKNKWITGINNPAKSDYMEDEVVPFRFYVDILTAGTHTLTIEYQTTKAGKHAYDYLMTYDATETSPIDQGITNYPWSGPSTYPIPVDPNVTGAGVTQQPGNFTIYNGTITAVSGYTLIGPYTGDSNTQVTITFTAITNEVLIVWGGHIAAETDWGAGSSASSISGAPYHMKLIAIDGESVGERDLQLSLAKQDVETGIEITATKTAVPELKRTYKWTIEKSVYPEKWDLLKGDTGTSTYKIKVTKSVDSDTVTVTGQICVENLDADLSTENLTIIDSLKYKTDLMTDWEVVPGAIVTKTPNAQIPAGATVCYDYSFTFIPVEGAEYKNVAKVTITNYDGYLGVPYGVNAEEYIGEITTPTTEVLSGINVDDSNGQSFQFSTTDSVMYSKKFDCDDEGVNENTATIVETKQYDTASVTVTCYSLDIEKDAETSFKRYFKWTIDKWAEYEVFDIDPCIEDSVLYKVTLDTSSEEADFKVKGTITIHNGTPLTALINKLEDVIDGAILIELDDNITFPYKLWPDSTIEIKYRAKLPDSGDRTNIATAFVQNYDFVMENGEIVGTKTGETEFEASVKFTFDDPEEIDECVKVTDTNLADPLAEKLCAPDAPKTFEYYLPFGPYFATGSHVNDNIGKFVTNDTQTEGSDEWKLTINVKCLPVVAAFSAEPSSGVSPLKVQFTDLSENAGKWLWEFGDGTTSDEQNPCHTFENPPHKYYDVKLTVWDCCEEYMDSITKENFVQVIRPTSVEFGAYPIVGPPELEVQFMNLSGGIANTWIWTYGDGTSEEYRHSVMNKINPIHVYTDEGSYNVCLEGTGQGGYDKMCVNDLIYVDKYYAPLELVESGQTLEGEEWDDVIDHDVIPPDASLAAISGDAWAIFKFTDSKMRSIHKIRVLSNNVFGSHYKNHLAKDFQLWVSNDGVNFTPGFVGTLSFLSEWEEFEFDGVNAKYLKLVLLNARGPSSPYIALCEFQVFGKIETENKKLIAFATAEENQIVSIPTEFGLSQNYPNPFNPETSIDYQLPEDADVRLDIYNVKGELVNTLIESHMSAGYHHIVWNGRDRFGNGVSGGLYFYSIQIISENSEKFLFTKKMILLK